MIDVKNLIKIFNLTEKNIKVKKIKLKMKLLMNMKNIKI